MVMILVILVISLTIVLGQNVANRNLKYYDGDRHSDLESLYSSGDSSVLRRRLTHTPSKHPTKSAPLKGKPTIKPVKRAPTRKPTPKLTRKPTRQPTRKPKPTNNPYISIGSIYQTSPNEYLKFVSPTQVTRYIKEGSTTTCTSLPYLLSSNNFLVIPPMGGGSLTKTSKGLKYTSLENNEAIEMTTVTSNPLESQCNPETSIIGSFKSIVSTFNQDDVYESDETYYDMKIYDSNKFNIKRYYDDGSCESLRFASIIGPFVSSGFGLSAFMVAADSTLVENFWYLKETHKLTYTKATELPSGYQCDPMPSTLTPLDVMQIYPTNISGKLVASIVMKGSILAYYVDSFNQYGNGIVYQLQYKTGGVTSTTFNIKNRYSNDRYNAEPLFFNGTELFVACTEGNFIKGFYSGVYHDFPADLSISKDVKYGKIGSKSYLFYSRFKPGSWEIDDIYSYDMNTKVSQKLNVFDNVKDYFMEDTSKFKNFNIKDNKIIWMYNYRTGAILYYDLNTSSAGSFVSLKLHLINDAACFTCDDTDAPLVSSNNDLLIIVRDGLTFKNSVVISLGPLLTITSNTYTITNNLKLRNDISGIVYFFKANNELQIFNDALNDASICSTKKWKQLDNGFIYTSDGSISYLTKPSTPAGVITYNGIDMKLLPMDSKLPSCLPEITVLKRSTNNLNAYSFFSGSLDSDLILVDTQSNPQFKTTYHYYNTTSNREIQLQVQTPPKPSNFPSNVGYNLLYPISVSGVWVTENPPYLIRNNVAINISPASPESIVINENGDYAVSIVNDHLVKINLSTGSYTNEISLPGLYDLSYLGNNRVIAASKELAIVYDMSNGKSLGYINFGDVTEQCGTVDWNFDGMAISKRGLSVAITCYNTDDDSTNHFINLYRVNL